MFYIFIVFDLLLHGVIRYYNKLMRRNKPNGNLIQTYYFRNDDEAKYTLGKMHMNKRKLEQKPGVISIHLQD